LRVRLDSWWQTITHHSFITTGIIVVLFAFIAFTFAIFTFGWDWTGFNGGESKVTTTMITPGTTVAIEQQPAKTLWDWLGLLGVLAIPVVVGFGAAWFTAQQGKVSDRENTDNQRETALQAYIDKISELLLHEHLGESTGNHQVETIARARTATVLRTLDPVRRGSLIRFLSRAGILVKCTEKEKAMAGLDLHGADLSRLNLRNTNLSGANLSGAFLSESDLIETSLIQAKISEAFLFEANLSGADLTRADLSRAFLYGAKLRGAKIMQEQWEQAKSLKGATMPDGSIHP
jgi:Pentapeptide repeats (8 copies)